MNPGAIPTTSETERQDWGKAKPCSICLSLKIFAIDLIKIIIIEKAIIIIIWISFKWLLSFIIIIIIIILNNNNDYYNYYFKYKSTYFKYKSNYFKYKSNCFKLKVKRCSKESNPFWRSSISLGNSKTVTVPFLLLHGSVHSGTLHLSTIVYIDICFSRRIIILLLLFWFFIINLLCKNNIWQFFKTFLDYIVVLWLWYHWFKNICWII